MRNNHKKQTFEDKFDRKYRCNSYIFIGKIKKENNKKFRRISKKEIEKKMNSDGNIKNE